MARATTTKCINANPIRNNGAVVVYGTVNSAVTAAYGRTLVGARKRGSYKPIAPLHEAALNFTQKILSSGTFAYQAAGNYAIRKVTRSLSGVSKNSIYMGPVALYDMSIYFTEHNITSKTNEVTFNYVSGQPSIMPIPVSNDSFGSDTAARPTRAVPGHVFIKYGISGGVNKPVTKNYPAKTT